MSDSNLQPSSTCKCINKRHTPNTFCKKNSLYTNFLSFAPRIVVQYYTNSIRVCKISIRAKEKNENHQPGMILVFLYFSLLVSGKIYLCVLENTNRRSRKSIARITRILVGCYLAYRIRTKGRESNCTNTIRMVKFVVFASD